MPNTKWDRAWCRRVYASVPNCQHYVTIAADRAEVVSFDRAEGWRVHDCRGLIATLELPAIDVSIPLRDIYRSTRIQ